MSDDTNDKKLYIVLLLTLTMVFVWSAITPFDYFTWILEALPVMVGLAVVLSIYKKFRFTNLAYILMLVHAIILLIGAHYTYAKVPAFDYIRELFQLSRNHYDRLGHFAQGFIPAILAREILLRTSPLRTGKWLFAIVVCVCLAISACYELFEWLVAELTGTAAQAFLGTQGDVWDTQKDIALALIGAIAALLILAKPHDRMLRTSK